MSTLLDHDKHLIDVNEFRSFMFQGRANFTLLNVKENTHITFYIKSRKVKRNEPEETRFFEVKVKAIGDKVMGKVELGEIDRTTGSFKKNKGIQDDHIGVKTIDWIISKWRNLEDYGTDRLKIFHINKCCRCGMPLTQPESIQNGIGPDCVIGRMKKTLKMMEDLGLVLQEGANYLTEANYDVAVAFAIQKFPHYLDKFFIPARLRRKDEFIGNLYELDKYGLW